MTLAVSALALPQAFFFALDEGGVEREPMMKWRMEMKR